MKPLPTATTTKQFQAIRERAHPGCFVCSPSNPLGLRLDFTLLPDGSVESTFAGGAAFEGYSGYLHGGVAAALLDGAMTNLLFAHGLEAFTAELRVRYRHPVAARSPMTVSARWDESHGLFHSLRAELRQDAQIKVTAVGKFLERHE